MAQDHNPREAASRFFGSLSYRMVAGEQIELRYLSVDQLEHDTEYFEDLETAARRAAALATTCHVLVGTRPLTKAASGEAQSRLLACWTLMDWHARLPEDFIVKLTDEPLPTWVEIGSRRLDGGFTGVTASYYYPDRCSVPERIRSEAETFLLRSQNGVGGWRGRL